MSRKIKIGLIVVVILFTASTVGGYLYAENSEPYVVASKYLKNHNTLEENIGTIKNQKLGIFGYSISFSGPRGRANFKIEVEGTRNKGNVYIAMLREAGIWDISKANLILNSGQTVVLK